MTAGDPAGGIANARATGPVDFDAARVALARACRVMAHRGLVDDVLGHVSLRVDERRLLVRCRGPKDESDVVHISQIKGHSFATAAA